MVFTKQRRRTLRDIVANLTATATAAESGSTTGSAEVSIRRYPFPYVSALAVSNDCDGSTIEAFEDWHGFVNGNSLCAYGEGLGLEIGDSFWAFAGGSTGLCLSTGLSDAPTADPQYAERLAELGRIGWFDTLHSLGNWKQDYKQFRHDLGQRADVERALEMLQKREIRPFVYTNHSWSPSNVSGPWGYYQKIDVPTHPMYGMDLLRDFGFRYFWPDNAVEMKKFGDELTYNTDDEIRQALSTYGAWNLLYKRISQTEYGTVDFDLDDADKRRILLSMFNRTMTRVDAMDNGKMIAFKRYRGPWPADESSFSLQASPGNLDSLEERGGTVVLYQHFGVTRGGSTGEKQTLTKPPVLSDASVEAWRDIARRNRAGKLFVATTGRLLDYLCIAENLAFSVAKSDTAWTIKLAPLRNSNLWSKRSEECLLNGLAFLIPDDAPEVSVVTSDNRRLDFSRRSDSENPGKHACYREWKKLDWAPLTSN